MKRYLNTKIIIPFITLMLGVIWVYFGITQFGFWKGTSPGSGFFPAIVGVLISLLSISTLYYGFSEKLAEYNKTSFYPVIGMLIAIAFAFMFGFFPSLFLFVLLWLKIVESKSLSKCAVIAATNTAALYCIFSLWLSVPFPIGLAVEMMWGY
ncbi:tripartite tricarboxylate transporter TctB family protein [Photobacterium sp. ZSDE20]|uniref:Tripartite tricarboxylate transporter TctB family protein n=1 Tax=Photobacterium pectinilyticum TaxID=2906793 RepID=A0ABT1N2W8_9GAMM|nr:tripartite tricarboxylate transporter TctB family protein [Photobacterium sp. ZSDE20]MCQ1059050.1 tripartite tricarboxylate transporter TctB family protein [Photobacterium sp. ZSDE20]MDD1824207.1 tripartite tricarboxylate transporter TctB family protein [Photobacterium sp. ZSDE20]